MIEPTVNNNGNTRDDLASQAMEIHNAIRVVIGLISTSDISHGRNFQTVRDSTKHAIAQMERQTHLNLLQKLSDDYLKLAIAISKQ